MQEKNEETIASWHNFLDLNLELSVELGRTKMKIRDLLELEPESLVKLSRSTGEGVEIRADDKPLLRGEIFVLEDRAGVRVSEIIKEDN